MNQNITTYKHLFTKDMKDAFENKKGSGKKVYAIMTFNTEFELGLSSKPYEWVNSAATVTISGEEAVYLYMHTRTPMAKLIDASSFDELNDKMVQMAKNFKNPEYVNNEIESRFY